jgi:RNA polymerase sigma-70 factor (ECF subfamily)
MDSDDAALVARALGGSDDAFREIFERHHCFVYRFLYGMTGDHDRTEDLLQDTFAAAFRGLGTLRDESRLTTWLCAIAKNLAAKSYRGAAPAHESAGSDAALQVRDASTPEARLLGREIGDVVARALQQLDYDKRLVFTLKMIQGLSYQEIAAITGTAVAKLKTDLFRAKRRVRELLAADKEGRS